MLNVKFRETPMDSSVKVIPDQGEPYSDPMKYKQLVGKSNYLTVTHSDIVFVVRVVSQLLNSTC